MIFHSEGLTQDQIEFLHKAGSWLSVQGFYLAGGTAITIYYGHRRSLDLDWFIKDHISDPMLLAQQLRDAGIDFKTTQTSFGTLYGRSQEVRLSFIGFKYPFLKPVILWPETGCNLADMDDLACMKLSAVAQRGSKKDFFDMHSILTLHRPLEELLPLYCQKFQVEDISPVLYGLSYFDNAEAEPEPSMLIPTSWKHVKKDILKSLRKFINSKES